MMLSSDGVMKTQLLPQPSCACEHIETSPTEACALTLIMNACRAVGPEPELRCTCGRTHMYASHSTVHAHVIGAELDWS